MGPCFYHQSHPQLGVFFFGCIISFFLELFLHWSPVAYWTPTDLESSSFSVLTLRQEYWSGFPFPSPVYQVLSDISTMSRPSWVDLHSMAHSFIELEKAVVHVISLVSSVIVFFILSALWWIRIRGLWKLPDGRNWLKGNLGLVMGRAMLSKSLIQFSVDV